MSSENMIPQAMRNVSFFHELTLLYATLHCTCDETPARIMLNAVVPVQPAHLYSNSAKELAGYTRRASKHRGQSKARMISCFRRHNMMLKDHQRRRFFSPRRSNNLDRPWVYDSNLVNYDMIETPSASASTTPHLFCINAKPVTP